MPRCARVIPPEGYLHIISRGNNRRRLFFHPRDFKIFLKLLKELKNEESIKIFHYCIMPNHVHLLIGVGEGSNLSRFMKRLNMRYFYYFKKKHNYSGHLWQDRFKSKIIEKDEYFIQCGKYIELNPVRANIAKSAQDYPYSSYGYYTFGLIDKIIDDDPLYLDLGNYEKKRQLNYREMFISTFAYEKIRMAESGTCVSLCNAIG